MEEDVVAAKQRSATKISQHQSYPHRGHIIAVYDDHCQIIEKPMLH
jgi:hypothetical protein